MFLWKFMKQFSDKLYKPPSWWSCDFVESFISLNFLDPTEKLKCLRVFTSLPFSHNCSLFIPSYSTCLSTFFGIVSAVDKRRIDVTKNFKEIKELLLWKNWKSWHLLSLQSISLLRLKYSFDLFQLINLIKFSGWYVDNPTHVWWQR